LLSGLTHGFGGRGGSSSAGGSSGSDGSVGVASLSGAQYGSDSGSSGSNSLYAPFSPLQQAGYNLEQGSLGGVQGLAAPGQQQQQQAGGQGPFMGADTYSQAFQQLTKIPGQATGALAGYGTGLTNQGLQATQNLGNQMFQQVSQNLAAGQPVLGDGNQPMVVQGLGQDPNTYVIGGNDYYPGGAGQGQVQQFTQAPGATGGSSGLATGQFVPSTTQREQFAGGSLGSGGQFVSQPTQPAGTIDPTTGGGGG
jgi:hypothetical protein